MSRYPALIRVNDDASYDVTFPDLPDVNAAGPSLDDALEAAAAALQMHLDSDAEAPEPFAAGEPDATGAMLTLIDGAHQKEAARLVEVTLSLDAQLMARIDAFRTAQGFATREMFFTHVAQNALQRPARSGRDEGERREFKPRGDRPQREDFATREPRASTQFFRDGDKKRGGSFKPRRDDDAPRNPRRTRPEEGSFEERPKRAYRPRDEESSDRPRREYKPRDARGGDRPSRPYTPRGDAEGGDRPRRPYTPRSEEGGERPRKPFSDRKSFGDKKPYGKPGGFGGKGGGSKGGMGFRKGPRG
jgi:predicted RNase H-like HicB family nuclease